MKEAGGMSSALKVTTAVVELTPKQADGFAAAEITMEGLLIGKRRFELF